MSTSRSSRTAFHWRIGAWLGVQLGCTAWMLMMGLLLLKMDPLAAWTSLAVFVLLNAWGAFLWQRRAVVSAYAGLQWLLAAVTVGFAVVVLTGNRAGAIQPRLPDYAVVSYLPHWAMLTPPALMLMFYLRERAFRRRPPREDRPS
ncbi:MAG: hypothetical protein KDI71_14735 [Xanthomonadales bacterium]|nr:hypothetical protein [Xanthomonadales bacterium]